MNPKSLGASIWLLLFGIASVLLIGAFARFDGSGQPDGTAAGASAPSPAAARADISGPAASPAIASAGVPALPADLSPGLAEIIKLAQAHIGNDTILAYIQNSGQTYNPTADEILYLSDLGVSDKVVAALVNKPDPALAATPAPTPTPVPESMLDITAPPPPSAVAGEQPPLQSYSSYPSYSSLPPAPMPPAVVEEPPPLQNPQDSYFYNSLAPYGNWVQTAGGWCWQPMAATVDSGWLPYCDRGHWLLTDDGWYWASDYSWGWAPFHYGRWSHDGRFGWVWFPGNDWAPAWVAWRNTEGFAGWAALPPGAHYRPGVGFYAVTGLGALNASYGLNAASFTFVAQEHFLSRNVGRFAAPAPRAAALFAGSTPVNNYSFAGGRIRNTGVTAGQIAAATKASVPTFALAEASSPETAGGGSAGRTLAVFRPNVAAPAVPSSGGSPTSPVLINKSPRPVAVDGTISRRGSARPALAARDNSAQTPRPSSAASPARSILVSGNSQAAQGAGTTPSSPAPTVTGYGRGGKDGSYAATATARSSLAGGDDLRRFAAPSTPAPAVGFPSYRPPTFNSAPPVVTGTGPSYNAPQHIAPAGSVSPGGAPVPTAPASAPVESRVGGAQGGRGSGSVAASSSAPSSGANSSPGSSQSPSQGSSKASR